MAIKTTGKTTTRRSKKTETTVPAAAAVQALPEAAKQVRKKTTAAKQFPNVEEEIRRRAYELYLERRATAGDASGDQNQDWLIAEREVRARQNDSDRHTA